MKILKWILIVVGILIAVPLIAGLFINGEYAVVKETTINKPNDQVFDYIKHIKNQDNYSVWSKMDPNMKKTYTGTDATVGFISAWEGDKKTVGTGEQEITKIEEGKRLDTELRFKVPFEAKDNAYFTTEPVDNNSTHVTWGFTGKMPYPMNIMCPFMNMEKMLGPDLQTGLDNMKVELEKMPAAEAPVTAQSDTTRAM